MRSATQNLAQLGAHPLAGHQETRTFGRVHSWPRASKSCGIWHYERGHYADGSVTETIQRREGA